MHLIQVESNLLYLVRRNLPLNGFATVVLFVLGKKKTMKSSPNKISLSFFLIHGIFFEKNVII